MLKRLTVNKFGAKGRVGKVREGYCVIITIPFFSKSSAESCLAEIYELKEVMLVK